MFYLLLIELDLLAQMVALIVESYDLSYLRCIPNMVIMAPSNEEECKNMLYTGYLA
jgi:hypothetical protein